MTAPRPAILVIDDDASVRSSFASHIEDLDYRVFTAENGRCGVNVFEKERIDLVMVDIRMPEMDGLQVLDRIAATDPDTPVIVVSGTGEISDVVDALHKGAWDYLLKPIDRMSILTHAIENALEKSSLKRDNHRYQQHLELMVAQRTADLARANDRLRESQQQLVRVQKLEAIGTLAGGIAHDFNNILSSVIGYTEIVLDDELPPDTPAKGSLENVLKASLRAKNLVKQILTFSRQTRNEKMTINLESIVKEVLKLIRASLPATIDIRQEISLDSSTMLGDPAQIYQVLMNLCTNAGYAMRKDGGVLNVVLAGLQYNPSDSVLSPDMEPGSYAVLSVTDNGPGMSPSVQEQVFNPFFTTKPKEEGTGLGLSVVHGIVKEHGGVVEVQSAPGEGSCFRVCFPLLMESEKGRTESQVPLPSGNERILVVDDEQEVADVTRLKLVSLGYAVTAVSDSHDAWKRFMQNPDGFDLILTDQTMPGMTGDKLALKILTQRPDIPVILFTGFSHVVDAARAKAIGIRDLIMKPVVSRDLARIVRRALDQSKEERNHGKNTDR